jgi:dTDP-4-amino-4,6-dideoxygalactose transaminase
MSEMQAALGRTQTARLPQTLGKRRDNFNALKKGLEGTAGIRILDAKTSDAANSHYCLVMALEGTLGAKRNEVVAALNAAGVGTSVYYPQPVPRMKYYREKYGYDAARYPVATEISDRSIALPVGQHLGLSEMQYVADNVRAVLETSR